MSNDISYWRAKAPKCPHCERDQKEFHDGAGWEDGETWCLACESCGKEFWVLTTTSVHFSSAVSEEDASDENCGPQMAAATLT
jgi:hypothetical protein